MPLHHGSAIYRLLGLAGIHHVCPLALANWSGPADKPVGLGMTEWVNGHGLTVSYCARISQLW